MALQTQSVVIGVLCIDIDYSLWFLLLSKYCSSVFYLFLLSFSAVLHSANKRVHKWHQRQGLSKVFKLSECY